MEFIIFLPSLSPNENPSSRGFLRRLFDTFFFLFDSTPSLERKDSSNTRDVTSEVDIREDMKCN